MLHAYAQTRKRMCAVKYKSNVECTWLSTTLVWVGEIANGLAISCSLFSSGSLVTIIQARLRRGLPACQLPKTWYSQWWLISLTYSLLRKWWSSSGWSFRKIWVWAHHYPQPSDLCKLWKFTNGNLLQKSHIYHVILQAALQRKKTPSSYSFCWFPWLGTTSAVLLEQIFFGGHAGLSVPRCCVPVGHTQPKIHI